MTERIFTVGGGRGEAHTGVLTLAATGARHFRHLPTDQLAGYALAQAGATATQAVTLHAGTPTLLAGLDLQFALHLAEHRRTHLGLPAAAAAISATCPDLGRWPGAVRVPHLTLIEGHPEPVDTVVWEVMARDTATTWLGGRDLPDQEYFEAHLEELLTLRQDHRHGRLDNGPLARTLGGGYLSIRAAYLNEELVRDFIDAPARI